jgi:catalase
MAKASQSASAGTIVGPTAVIATNDPKAPAVAARPRLGTASTPARFAMIGVALAAVAGTFGYFGGWFAPNELTPARFTDGFEQVDGAHSGFRRNHAKGVGVSGFFESNGNGVRLSEAVVFRPGRVPVIGRFSLGGGQPYAADAPDAVRGLGLQFSLADGELWRTAMINLPVFPARNPEAFYERLIASKPDPSTGKPDPANMKAFLARHPETVQALTVIKGQPVSSGFDNSTFHGLNAFRFVNAAGDSTPVRWLMTPAQPFEAARTASAAPDKYYLFDALIAAIYRQPLRWHLLVIVGQPGDPTNDATIAWPAGREQVDVGTLTLDRVESEETSAATDLNFDPLVLPAGIAPSDDPLLSARSAVYSQSFTRRAGEAKQPSAIAPADARKGE